MRSDGEEVKRLRCGEVEKERTGRVDKEDPTASSNKDDGKL